jgi:hypothetical protein
LPFILRLGSVWRRRLKVKKVALKGATLERYGLSRLFFFLANVGEEA